MVLELYIWMTVTSQFNVAIMASTENEGVTQRTICVP